MQFAQIPFHSELKQTLLQALRTGQVAHAQVFAGMDGGVQLAMALAYITYLHCHQPTQADSCGQCPACSQMARLAHPDVAYVFPNATTKQVSKDPVSELFLPQFRSFVLENPYGYLQEWGQHLGTENKQLIINVNDARAVLKAMAMKPYEAKYKVVLMWMPEMMRVEAANALLKILEEPAPNTLFLLVSADTHRLLATIVSRCQFFYIPPYSAHEVAEYLNAQHGTDPDTAMRTAVLAEGVLRKAQVLQEEPDTRLFDFFSSWMRACFTRKFAEVFALSEEFARMGREQQKNVLSYALQLVRHSLMAHLQVQQALRLPQQELSFVQKFGPFISLEVASQLRHLLEEAHTHIERNANARLVFVDSSFTIATLLHRQAA